MNRSITATKDTAYDLDLCLSTIYQFIVTSGQSKGPKVVESEGCMTVICELLGLQDAIRIQQLSKKTYEVSLPRAIKVVPAYCKESWEELWNCPEYL